MSQTVFPDPAWNATDAEYPDTLHIQQLFERQVDATPDSIALVDRDTLFTYAALNAITNQLAYTLRARGVRADSIVGCYLTRSSSIVICTLAILKAGGAYVLLDANLPLARLENVVTDADPDLIITDTVRSSFVQAGNMSYVSLHDLEEAAKNAQSKNLAPQTLNASAAYIAYTSGSTGLPKGVVISHKSTVNHAWAFSKEFGLSHTDRVCLMAPITFDMAIEEMIPPLVSGCRVIVSKSRFDSMEEFHDEIIQNKYTLLNLPASLWQEWVEYMASRDLAVPETVRVVIAGSEEIETKSLQKWHTLRRSDEVRWAAAYGTTETSVTSTIYTSEPSDNLDEEPFVPIGRPIANTYAYVLGPDLRPVPVCTQGELYIGGHGVANGYLHKEALTRKKFLPNAFRDEPGARMYKTGDLARYRPNGDLVWEGRADEQFKFNGLRIEPGEIEAVLDQSPDVQHAVVVLQLPSGTEGKRIVAFILTNKGHTFDEAALRELASALLPALMVPSRFVEIGEWPITVNGKIDRRQLEEYRA